LIFLGTLLKAIFLPLVGLIPLGLEMFELLSPLDTPVDDPYMIPLPVVFYLFCMFMFAIGY